MMMNDFDIFSMILASGHGSQCSVVVLKPGQYPELWNQFLVLRYRSFGKWEGTDPELGRETDRKDKHSVFVLVVWEGIVVAGCRLIDGEKTNLVIHPGLVQPGRKFEISRMLIRSEIKDRATRDRIMFALCQEVVQYAFEVCRYDYLYCDTRLPFFVALRRIFGEALTQIGEQHDEIKNGETLTLVPTCVTPRCVAIMRQRFIELLRRREQQWPVAVVEQAA